MDTDGWLSIGLVGAVGHFVMSVGCHLASVAPSTVAVLTSLTMEGYWLRTSGSASWKFRMFGGGETPCIIVPDATACPAEQISLPVPPYSLELGIGLGFMMGSMPWDLLCPPAWCAVARGQAAVQPFSVIFGFQCRICFELLGCIILELRSPRPTVVQILSPPQFVVSEG